LRSVATGIPLGTGSTLSEFTRPRSLAIVGRGRLGLALASAARSSGYRLIGPLPRDYSPGDLAGTQMILLCVPDREIVPAALTLAERMPEGEQHPILVGHCSGATPLAALEAENLQERFSVHPLMTFSGAHQNTDLRGIPAAVSGSSALASSAAFELAENLGLSPFSLDEADRATYHAAASIASNFLITLECAAETLAATAGCDRQALVPLIRRTVDNWAVQGRGALTGPIARGDQATVARQRRAVGERAPELLELFDALARATRELASADTHRSRAEDRCAAGEGETPPWAGRSMAGRAA
jgi:predicted short-subunit dehydrogenase-like oxidoreductase (DUF2520 family)